MAHMAEKKEVEQLWRCMRKFYCLLFLVNAANEVFVFLFM